MSPEPEDFEQLERLMKLKRYEQPPPRYFQGLSERVASRICVSNSFQPELTWWERLGFDFDLKPALVCILGIAICGFLSAGVITSLRLQGEGPPRTGNDMIAMTSLGSPLTEPEPTSGFTEEVAGSTVPVINPAASSSPFNRFSFRAEKAGFKVGFGGN